MNRRVVTGWLITSTDGEWDGYAWMQGIYENGIHLSEGWMVGLGRDLRWGWACA